MLVFLLLEDIPEHLMVLLPENPEINQACSTAESSIPS
jgi:hypothetical protein